MPKRIKRPGNYTRARLAFETREKNIHFSQAVKRAQDRANLKMERDRLHGLLQTSIHPGLREKVYHARGEISSILGD